MKHHFTHADCLALASRIEQLTDRKDYGRVFDIILRDRHNHYTKSSEGVVLDLSTLSDRTLRRITRYLDREVQWPEHKITQVVSGDSEPDRAYRMSNYERNVLRYNKRHQETTGF